MEVQIITGRENVVLDSEPLGPCDSALVLETVGLIGIFFQDASDLVVGPGGAWHSKCDTFSPFPARWLQPLYRAAPVACEPFPSIATAGSGVSTLVFIVYPNLPAEWQSYSSSTGAHRHNDSPSISRWYCLPLNWLWFPGGTLLAYWTPPHYCCHK